MPQSNVTKKVLAAGLKKCVESKNFTKITILDICEECGMNRKSFYYHFKDKFDLVNWIYDVECLKELQNKNYESFLNTVEFFANYFYENRSFYNSVFEYQGQNSFTDYFKEIIYSFVKEDYKTIFPKIKDYQYEEFAINISVDLFVCAIIRWIKDPDDIPPEEFCRILKTISIKIGETLYKNLI